MKPISVESAAIAPKQKKVRGVTEIEYFGKKYKFRFDFRMTFGAEVEYWNIATMEWAEAMAAHYGIELDEVIYGDGWDWSFYIPENELTLPAPALRKIIEESQ